MYELPCAQICRPLLIYRSFPRFVRQVKGFHSLLRVEQRCAEGLARRIPILFIVLCLCRLVFAGGGEYVVCTQAGRQGSPDIWQDWVVWHAHVEGGDSDVWAGNLSSGALVRITYSGAALNPRIDGGVVVWQDARSGEFDIYAYDLTTGVQWAVCADSGNQVDPAIGGGRIVWRTGGYPQWDSVWAHTISDGRTVLVCDAPGNKWRPDVDGNIVVWGDYRNGNWDVFGYDLAGGGEFVVADGAGYQRCASIDGGLVAYEECLSGDDGTVGVYDIAGGTRRYLGIPGLCDWVGIQGKYVVWGDYRGNETDIYGLDLETDQEFNVCSKSGWQFRPAVYGDTAVWADDRNGAGNRAIWGRSLTDTDYDDVTIEPEVTEVDKWFTEFFEGEGWADAFDLAYTAITLVPHGSTSYAISSEAITSLPTDPAGGTVLPLGDDAYATVSVNGSTFHVGSNGYVTFREGDRDYSESLTDHFDTMRLSAYFTDLDPSSGGSVSWKQAEGSVVVTWENVPDFGGVGSNTFQLEMYDDGGIRFAWLGVTTDHAIVGLSGGGGIPADFEEADMSSYAGSSGSGSGSGEDPGEFYTEIFEADEAGFDLMHQAVVLTPAGDGSYMTSVREVSGLPTDPAGGTVLSLQDDDYVGVETNGQTFYVGSNGYITFDEGDYDYSASLADHFQTARLSGLFTDLDPSSGGRVTWKRLWNRIVVTWEDVPGFGGVGSNTFQIEMYDDGSVQMAWLDISAERGVVGVSGGGGVPSSFVESDLSGYEPYTGGSDWAMDDSLVGYWSFDEGYGDTAYDSAGLADATVVGPQWVSDAWGTALSFDGIDDYVQCPHEDDLEISGEIALSAWIRIPEIPEGDNWTIISSEDESTFTGISLSVSGGENHDSQSCPPGHLRFRIGNGYGWLATNANARIPTGRWVHVAVSRKAGEDAVVYYDGVPQASSSMGWDGHVAYLQNWTIGASTEMEADDCFFGAIGAVRVFKEALSQSEIDTLCIRRISVGKKTNQSSTAHRGYGWRATDNNTNGIYRHGSVTCTSFEAYPWWEVDLEGQHYIEAIHVWNRTDCAVERLDDYYIFVSRQPFTSSDPAVTAAQSGVWSRHVIGVPLPDALETVAQVGRYVRIQLARTDYLHLAEVEVIGRPIFPHLANVAMGRPTLQSSTAFKGDSRRATDGNTDGIYRYGSVTCTACEANPWWEVDLEDVHYIEAIELWNRTDVSSERLDDYYVFVSQYPFTSMDPLVTASDPQVWALHATGIPLPDALHAVGRKGRYIRVQLARTDYLHLAEVRIFGERIYMHDLNVAAYKATAQSSTAYNGDRWRAVDDNTQGTYRYRSVTCTAFERNPWWEVDLGAEHDIEAIEVWNRTDCALDRLKDYYVFVSSEPFSSEDIDTTASQTNIWSRHVFGVPLPNALHPVGTTGRYIRIQLRGTDHLHLAEVRVLGQSSY